MIPVFDSDTDYAALEVDVRNKFSLLSSDPGYDYTKLYQVARYLKAADIDKLAGNVDRYNNDIKLSYLILFNGNA